MNVKLNPDTIHAPAVRYVHTVKTPANAEWLTISGQVGVGKRQASLWSPKANGACLQEHSRLPKS